MIKQFSRYTLYIYSLIKKKSENILLLIEDIGIALFALSFICFLILELPFYNNLNNLDHSIQTYYLWLNFHYDLPRIIISVMTLTFWLTAYLVNRRLELQRLPLQIPRRVNDALEGLASIRNPILARVFLFLPWILLLIAFIGINPTLDFYSNTLTNQLLTYKNHYWGLATAAASMLLFQILMQRIPATLGTLWNRNAIASKEKDTSREISTRHMPDTDTEKQFINYLGNLDQLLNSPRQIIVGLICGYIGAGWILSDIFYYFTLNRFIENDLIIFSITFITAYIVGLQFWRMIVTGLMIYRLSDKFDIIVQRGHPDGCGGLAPLGNLCLWNALVLSPGGIFYGSRFFFDNIISFKEFHYFSLLMILLVATFSFFAPIWDVHKIMTAKRDLILQQLDELGHSINLLSRDLLDKSSQLDPKESEKMTKKLENLNQIYKANQTIPVWPFNTQTLIKFITSQIVPLLSLLGLGEPIIAIVKSLTTFFAKLNGS